MQASQPIAFPTSLPEFLQWDMVDGYKYEWNKGKIVRFGSISTKHLQLMRRLLDLIDKGNGNEKKGLLIKGQDVQLSYDQLRRPDFSYFTSEQIENAQNEEPIPEFIIEFVFAPDKLVDFKNKLKEYFKYGVKVVWLIYPDDKLVEVYTSYKNIQVCTDADICSAKPVLPDFEIAAASLFE